MRAASTFCVVAALVGAVSTNNSERFLGDVPLVGLGSTASIATRSSRAEGPSAIPTSGDRYTTTTTTTTTIIGPAVEAEVIQALEADERVTVVAPVEVGEVLLCDTLERAEDAAVLSFVLRQNEAPVTAERSSYTVTHGGAFTDGIGRKVWTGIVIDPVQAQDEAVPRTVSMTWGDVCDTELFLLKVTTRNTDGTTRLLKTVPCDGSSTHTCLVEISVEFEESADAISPDTKSSSNSVNDGAEGSAKDKTKEVEAVSSGARAASDGGSVGTIANSRGDQDSSDTAVIDMMILYSASALDVSGITGQQMETVILESLVGTNEAFKNSGVSASVNPVHIGLLNGDVADLRDEVGADLVMLIAYFRHSCGQGYLFEDDGSEYGFSVVNTSCLDNFSHTHELGHNLGCYHNREDTSQIEDYAHGYRQCDGDERFETLMSYSCGSTRVNYFSNPDVEYNGEPTGTSIANNARAIENNMVAVSNYREAYPTAPPPTSAPVPTSAYRYHSYVGCYEDDNLEYPVLSGDLLEDDVDMTIEVCADFCLGSPYFGTRDGKECVCGKDSDEPREEELQTCTSECAGNVSQICGDRRSMSVYEYLEAAEVHPSQHRGCWTDARAGRIMSVMQAKRFMTNDLCASMCHGYPFYGLQYGRECWCGNGSTDYAEHGKSSTCDMECSGDADTLCGGYYSMDVFEYQRP